MERRIGIGGLALAVALGCAAPDAERDGFLLLDEGARAAGVAVEVEGEVRSDALPVAVPGGGEAALLRADGEERITVAPGELIEVVGPDGRLRRSSVPRDGFVASGDADAVRSFAEMIGARATPTFSGRFRVEGPDAFALAALLRHADGVRGVMAGPPRATANASAEAPSEVIDVGFRLTHDPTAASAEDPALAGPVPDPAALVGLYRHRDAALILDAAGGYAILDGAAVTRRGTFRPRPGGVDFVPDDGGPVATMRLRGETLVDDYGIRFGCLEGL